MSSTPNPSTPTTTAASTSALKAKLEKEIKAGNATKTNPKVRPGTGFKPQPLKDFPSPPVPHVVQDYYTFFPVEANDPLVKKFNSSISPAIAPVLAKNNAPWTTFTLWRYGKGIENASKLPLTIVIETDDPTHQVWSSVKSQIKTLCVSSGAGGIETAVIQSKFKLFGKVSWPWHNQLHLGEGISVDIHHQQQGQESSGTLGGYITLHWSDGTTKDYGLTNHHVLRWWDLPEKWDPSKQGEYDERGSSSILSPSVGDLGTVQAALLQRLESGFGGPNTLRTFADKLGVLTASILDLERAKIDCLRASNLELLEWIYVLEWNVLTNTTTVPDLEQNLTQAFQGANDKLHTAVKNALESILGISQLCWLIIGDGYLDLIYNGFKADWEILPYLLFYSQNKYRVVGETAFYSRLDQGPAEGYRLDWGLFQVRQPAACGEDVQQSSPYTMNSTEAIAEWLPRAYTLPFYNAGFKTRLPDVSQRPISQGGPILGIRQIEEGMVVFKNGNRTGPRVGTINPATATYKQRNNPPAHEFQAVSFDPSEKESFAGPGDSGSFILDADRNLVGLLFAGIEGFSGRTFMTDIHVIFDDILAETKATRIQLTGTQVFYPS